MRISYWSSDVCSSDLDSFPVSGAPCKRIGSTKSLQYAGEARVVAQRGKIGIVFDPGTVAPAEVNGALEQFEGTIDYAETGERAGGVRSAEHTSELQSLMRISYAVFCLKKHTNTHTPINKDHTAYQQTLKQLH